MNKMRNFNLIKKHKRKKQTNTNDSPKNNTHFTPTASPLSLNLSDHNN